MISAVWSECFDLVFEEKKKQYSHKFFLQKFTIAWSSLMKYVKLDLFLKYFECAYTYILTENKSSQREEF